MHTHSPCQYFESSSAFWAWDFLFPKTFKLVVVEVVGTTAEGLTTNPKDGDDKQKRANKMERSADFMVDWY